MNSYCADSRHRYHRHHTRPHFEKPLVLVKSIPHNRQIGVSPNIKAIKLIFGRDFNNDLCWVNACSEIDMWQGSDRVPIRISRVRSSKCDGQRVILVIPVNRLRGGVTYKVRVKSFFVDKHGESIKKTNLIVFTTGCRS